MYREVRVGSAAAEEFEVGAYFYPLTMECAARAERVRQVGLALGHTCAQVPDEFELTQDAMPLFPGHDQPRQYLLGDSTKWDDSSPKAVEQQMEIAAQAGLSYLVVDSYTGMKDGKPVRELAIPFDNFDAISRRRPHVKIARMEALESPRAVLPIPRTEPGSGNGFHEPNRQYDITPATAEYIADTNVLYWDNDAYMRIEDRPYLSLLMPFRPHGETQDVYTQKLMRFMDALRIRAQQHGYDPYVVGVVRRQGKWQFEDTVRWCNVGADAITQYVSLSTPMDDIGYTPIQPYDTLLDSREVDWYRSRRNAKKYGVPFLPSPAVGWDASPRGEQGYEIGDVMNVHPYFPMVVSGTPKSYGEMLRRAIGFARSYVPPPEQKVTVFAFNEIGEGGAMLPRRLPNGEIDSSYLDMTAQTIAKARTLGAATLQEAGL